MKRFPISVALIAALLFSFTHVPTASAAVKCPPAKSDGKTVGKIEVGSVTVNVKNVDYPEGKDLNPPKSPLNAGVSIRHQPLSADTGSSIIVWHINYNGCQGKLNVINNKKRGYQFSVKDENGTTTQYEVSKKVQVKKGKYDPDWFMLSGPRQLVLVTCTGKVVNRSYKDNLVIIATPVTDAESADSEV